jgi:hypothetical protein
MQFPTEEEIQHLQNATFAAISGLRTLDLPEDVIATTGLGVVYGLTHFLKRSDAQDDVEVAYYDMFFHGLAAFCVKYGGTRLNDVVMLIQEVGHDLYKPWEEVLLLFQDAMSKGDRLDLIDVADSIPFGEVFWALGAAVGATLGAGLFAVVADRRVALEYSVVLGGCAGLCSAALLAALGPYVGELPPALIRHSRETLAATD